MTERLESRGPDIDKSVATARAAILFGRMPSVAELKKLPVSERLALIDELWDSISESELSVAAAQIQEAQARWEELKADPSIGLSYDELKKRLG